MLKPNRKTLWSCEPSESCLRRLLGSPCSYCYTLHPWNGVGRKRRPPRLIQPFHPGSIASLPEPDKQFLRRVGLRFFSNCDYIECEEMVGYVKMATAEARMLGIPTKAITKNPAVVKHHIRDFDVINLSVDTLGLGVDWDVAKECRQKYPGKVMVRSVCITLEDVETFASWTDIITPYHGPQMAEYPPKIVKAVCMEKYPKKTCTHCRRCYIKCGLAQKKHAVAMRQDIS